MNALNSTLCMTGHIGQDIHLIHNHEIIITAGGSAYHFANGVRAAGGSVTLLAEIGRCVSDALTPTLKHPRIHTNAARPVTAQDTSFIYDYRKVGVMIPSSHFSIGAVETTIVERLKECMHNSAHLHVGTMNPKTATGIADSCRKMFPDCSMSCNFFQHYLEKDPDECIKLGLLCSIVFMNEDEYQIVKTNPRFALLLKERLIVVTCGEQGAVCIIDQMPVYAGTSRVCEFQNGVGAGDVFAGAFLATILASRCLSTALDRAVAIAGESVGKFGTDHLLDAETRNEPQENAPSGYIPPIHSALLAKYFEIQTVHLVRGAGLFVLRDNKLLLTTKPNNRAFQPDVYYVPDGELEPGETPEECAKRKLLEETGLNSGNPIYLGALLFGDSRNPGTLYRVSQFAIIDPIGDVTPADGVSACLWSPIADLSHLQLFALSKAQLQLLQLLHKESHWWKKVNSSDEDAGKKLTPQ